MDTYQIEFVSILSHQLFRALEGIGQTLLRFLQRRKEPMIQGWTKPSN